MLNSWLFEQAKQDLEYNSPNFLLIVSLVPYKQYFGIFADTEIVNHVFWAHYFLTFLVSASLRKYIFLSDSKPRCASSKMQKYSRAMLYTMRLQ